MKPSYSSIRNIFTVLFVWVFALWIIPINIFPQTVNDNTATISKTTLPAVSLEKDTLKSPSSDIDELKKRQDVHTSIEVTQQGDTITRYIYQPIDFGEIYTANSTINSNAKKAAVYNDTLITSNLETGQQMNTGVTIQSFNSGNSVGQIPFEEGVTPSGGKTIAIPIITANVASSTPQVAVSYNSQMGNSIAGYGWSVSGLSSISVSNNSIYYDKVNAPVDLSNPNNCVFSLDGTRLVTNNNSSLPEFHYETSQGYVLVKKIMAGNNIAYLEALLPNGSKAIYGFTNNTIMQHTYPITSIVDMKGYRIDFEYIFSGNMYFISKIKYGNKVLANHSSEIRFEYASRTDFTTAYISNIGISQDKLLKKITSYDEGKEIRTYSLTHTLSNNVNQLTRLDCSSGSKLLNPLIFGYDYYPSYMSNGQFNEEFYGFLSQYFNNSPANNLQFIRGKFRKNSFGDGMITFPGKFSTYGLLETRRRWVPFKYIYAYLYGSTYPADQTILIVPNLDFFSQPISIAAESGFQTINAVDVNGDGVDEIVKVNFNGTSGSKTTLKVTVYTLTSGTGYSTRTFNVNVEGVVNSDDHYYSPMSRSFYFGDFRGDGKVQMLSVSHNKTFDNKDRTSYFALIDLNAGNLLSENSLFSHSLSESKYVHTFDINGDGKSELCHASSSSYNVYSLSGNSFTHQYGSFAVPRSIFNKDVKFGDLNADGKLDILVPPDFSYQDKQYREIPVWTPHDCPFCGKHDPILDPYASLCRHCNQDIKIYFEQNPNTAVCYECGSSLQSCSNDPFNPYPNSGLCCPLHASLTMTEFDMGYVDNGNKWACYINTGKGFAVTYQNIVNTEYDDKFTVIDMNRDGLSDLIQIRGTQAKLFLNSKGTIQNSTLVNPITVTSGTSDFLPSNVVNYYNSSYLVCIKNAEIYTINFTKDASKASLLTSMTDSYGLIYHNTYSDMAAGVNYMPTTTYRGYPYASSIFPLNLLGSAYVSLPNYGGYVSHQYYTYYGAVIHQQGLGFCGFEKTRTIDYIQNMEFIENKDPQMFGVTTSTTSPLKDTWYYYLRNEESNKQANPRVTSTSETNKLTNIFTSSNYEYDSYNNPTKVTQSFGSGITQVTDQTYSNMVSSSRYLVGQPLIRTVTNTRSGSSWIDKEIIAYNTDRLPISRITYTGTSGTNKTSETRWTYDANGNMTSEKSAPYNVTEFMGNDYTYDSSGRYVATVVNAIGQKTTYSNYDKYGNAKTIKDYKNRTTTYDFDVWGNLISTQYPDGTTETVSADWGGQGLYTVTQTATGQPTSVVHYDALGRKLRAGNQRFDGQWQYVDNAYDSKGRIEKTSLPFKGSSPTHWNSYTYDNYNRPTKLTEASGKSSTWSYSGLSVTETKNGMATTKTTDASGALISVSDPGGTISYALRPDGQPSSITAPGGVVTSFGYDTFGRQTSITDPSAGTQTFSETYSTAGVRTNTVKDANNKTVTTISDKFGRATNVNRQEFNTTYTYNTDGLLTNETSTNGTSSVFTYDSYGRPATVRENAPDGRWLKKTFGYANGNVSSVQYESQNGTIATENFVYANGHNTEIRLNGTTTVWKLTEENALGQPTKATTGNINRTYSYTAYGMPTGRTAGSLQDFMYDFDVQKGNLLSRKDNKKNKTETFGYDNLNRLSAIGSQQISYAANGNITAMPGVGTLAYENSAKPYQVTMLTPTGTAVPIREQNVTYTSYQRPNTISEDGITASFAYNSAGDRVKMDVKQGATALLTRYYIGGQYELDTQTNTERLYLGGDVYSAPAIYVKEGANNWKVYYIFRDYLGSITHIANSDGSLKQELSYDAWGRLRNPATQVAYTPGSEPALFIGRGYTGHEHLPWFGLVNMNARLYDPLLGRFLSPDPYVQAPNFTQNYNRYSYCLNNPLVYVDENGEFIFSFLLPGVGAFIDAALWGAVIGGTSYTASVAMSSGGFSNWDWGQFGKSVGFGALSGAVSFGVGEAFSALGNFAGSVGTPLIQGGTHGLASGGISALQGGDFWSGFASGSLGSWSATGYGALGFDKTLGTAGMFGFGTLSGGIGSWATGGDFWQGAALGLITTSLNHAQHKAEEHKFFWRLKRHYDKGTGDDFKINRKELDYLSKKGKIGELTDTGDGIFKTSISFYGADRDLALSFGNASIFYNSNGKTVDFYDYYDFDSKPWGKRSYFNEIITRTYNALSINGKPFHIYHKTNYRNR